MKRIDQLSSKLDALLPGMLSETGIKTLLSFNGRFGGKHAQYIDIMHEVITSPDHFVSLYLEGFKKASTSGAHLANYVLFKKSKKLREFLYLFLQRTYLRNYDALTKNRPHVDRAALWIGQNNADYGLFVTPRFNKIDGNWENDKSEIRHFEPAYWSIGHVLQSGLCIPKRNKKMEFASVPEYLNFFENVLVRNSGSQHEQSIASLYCEFVRNSSDPLNIQLLIPELRYGGLEAKHLYRLDFCVLEPSDFNRIGFELSPWSSHGYLSKTQGLSQKTINEMASDNFEKEMKKHKDFFRKHGVFVLIYTDSDLKDVKRVFSDIERYLQPSRYGNQLQFHLLDEILT